jgi:hypothetical protein
LQLGYLHNCSGHQILGIMYEYFNKQLRKAMNRCIRCYSVPYGWYGKTSPIKSITNPRYCKIYRMLMSFGCFYIGITIVSLLLVIRFETSLILAMLGFGVAILAWVLICIRFMHSGFREIVPFLNAMISFQKENINIGKSKKMPHISEYAHT